MSSQCARKPLSRSCETRHHRSNRYADDVAYLPIRQILNFAENNYLTEFRRKRLDGSLKRVAFGSLNRECVGFAMVGNRRDVGERNDVGDPVPPLPGEATISYDRQKPGPRVTVPVPVEVSQCAENSVLNNVLCVMLVAQHIPRKRIRIVHMRNDDSLEPIRVAIGHQGGAALGAQRM